MSYHIFEKELVDMICRDYGGDPRVMIIALNGAVSDELRDLTEAAGSLADALEAGAEGDGLMRLEGARTRLEQAARRYADRQRQMVALHGG